MMSKAGIVFAIALVAILNAHAEDVIALRCVGEMTETVTQDSNGSTIRRQTVQAERHYELYPAKVVQHRGALISTTTREDLEGKNSAGGSIDESGRYTITSTQIEFFQATRILSQDPKQAAEGSIQTFQIDRQTGQWSASEAFHGPLTNLVETGKAEIGVSKKVSVNGTCQPWNPARKF